MNFNELSKSRKSIRNYTNQNIKQEDIIELIKAAQSAPSGGNCQSWHFYVVSDKNMQTEIVNNSCYQKFMLSAPVFIVVCADIKRSEARYGERGRNLYCIQDTAAAVQNILLCAANLGLGTCWCGAFDEERLSEILKLHTDMRPVAVVTVGYPMHDPVSVKRRPLEEIVTFIGEIKAGEELKEEETEYKFEHCDISGSIFNDVNLANSKFNNINFYGMDICDSNLAEGKIHDCNLSNFKIYNCKLDGMTVNGKDICGLLNKEV